MAVIKITMQPEGSNDYADELHPKTSADQIVETATKKVMTDVERTKLAGIGTGANVTSVAGKTGAVTLAPSDVGLGNVTNVAQLPITGGTMTGILYPQNNTSYTTGQARRIVLSTSDPSGGGNGDVWIKYTP